MSYINDIPCRIANGPQPDDNDVPGPEDNPDREAALKNSGAAIRYLEEEMKRDEVHEWLADQLWEQYSPSGASYMDDLVMYALNGDHEAAGKVIHDALQDTGIAAINHYRGRSGLYAYGDKQS
jgi:hypothetical protein